MGAVVIAAVYQGRVTATAAPPSNLEGSSLQPTMPKPRCRVNGMNTCSDLGSRDLGIVIGIGV